MFFVCSFLSFLLNITCIASDQIIISSVSQQSKESNIYNIELPNNVVLSSLEDFLHKMATDQKFCINVMRKIPQTARDNNLQKCGFVFESTKYSDLYDNSPFQIFLRKPSFCAENPPIYPLQSYSGSPENGSFGKYITLANSALPMGGEYFKTSDHAIRFKSNSCNLLIIPKGKYVSLYDFADKAPENELMDFWSLAYQTFKDYKAGTFALPCGRTAFRIAAHIGSNAGQTVPHFHLRLETR